MPSSTISLQSLIFCEAAQKGDLNAVEKFSNKLSKLDINNCHVKYNKKQIVTPLLAAINGRQKEIVLCLLDHGADPNSSLSSTSPLVAAINSGQEDIVELLLERGADVDLGNPLKAAINKANPSIVKKILARNPSLTPGKKDEPLLHLAITKGNDEIVEALLEKDKSIINTVHERRIPARIFENNPLYLAASLGHSSTVKLLLNHGAKTDIVLVDYSILDTPQQIEYARRNYGRTALQGAAANGDIATVTVLLERADTLKHSRGILCIPAAQGNLSVIKALTDAASKKGPKTLDKMVNAKNYINQGPVDLAYQHGHFETVSFLLKHGAIPSARTLKIALENSDKSLVNDLYEAALTDYISQRSKEGAPSYKKHITLFGKTKGFGYSKEQKEAAAKALQQAIAEYKIAPDDQNVINKIDHDLLSHKDVLQNGKLGIIFKHLSLSKQLFKKEISDAAVIQWGELGGYMRSEFPSLAQQRFG